MQMPEKPRKSSPGKWLELYGDYLYRYALRMVNHPETAEDIVQETLIAAYKGHRNYSGKSSEKTWMVGILKHKIIDHYRKKRQEYQVEDIELTADMHNSAFDQSGRWREGLSDWSHPEKALASKDFKKVLDRCIEDLPPNQAQVFALKEFSDMSGEQIRQALGISSTNNVWVMLSRARMRLQSCLEKHWFSFKNK